MEHAFSRSVPKRRIGIDVTGVVQGVGFRPFVYTLARSMGLNGFVLNTSEGVRIEVEGDAVDAFVHELLKNPPPLAELTALHTEEMKPNGKQEFLILPSLDQGGTPHLSPDVSICSDCLRELFDVSDRRYLYPFINCTHCGPRYSITVSVPYDRPNTTMAPFVMCDECLREYTDPSDRRFHAQPNACPVCGPGVEYVATSPHPHPLPDGERINPVRSFLGIKNNDQKACLETSNGVKARGSKALEECINALKTGGIVAVKGLGGFHLAAAAENEAAVETLRRRKRKNNKAFALMAPDMEHVKRYCAVSAEEEALLLSRERPIVLLRRHNGTKIPRLVAPNTPELGFMLPYTPLHALLFFHPMPEKEEGEPNFGALVMTSGNLSEEPIQKENDSAMRKLSPLADAFLCHDRGIFMRVDDSVVRSFSGQTFFIRRSRGYVPGSIHLWKDGPEVLACGADLKNTFTLTKGDFAIVSQHIGDMENFETIRFFQETLENLKSVYRVSPVAMAHDLHPGYFSTRWALEQEKIRTWGVQHHHAHIVSVMAEKGLQDRVIGIALDGSGYGTDGTVWGGEFLAADLNGFERLARFKAIPLPGGETAVRNPWMMAISYLLNAAPNDLMASMDELGFTLKFGHENIDNVLRILDKRDLSPLSSGAGRLFDAVASLLGLAHVNTYEGEAAMALEARAVPDVADHYPYDLSGEGPVEIDFSEAIRGVLNDLRKNRDKGIIAAGFHNTVARAVVHMARSIHAKTGLRDVALSGGVFQNRVLLGLVMDGLIQSGLTPHTNTKVPCNDGGISLGQAYLLREHLTRGPLSG